MINFLIENEIDVPEKTIQRNRNAQMLSNIPFDQNKKLMVVVRKDPYDPNYVEVFLKGAPEVVFGLCT